MDNSGHFGHDTTMDMTNFNYRNNSGDRKSHSPDEKQRYHGGAFNYDVRSQLLDEKEKRLTI